MRVAFLLLALAACDSDTFVGPDTGTTDDGGKEDAVGLPDGEGIDVQADVVVSETGTLDGSSGDASVQKSVLCNSQECSDICCGGALAWSGPFCQPASAEDTTLCTNWLACSDHTDCPSGQTCCATESPAVGGNVINSSYCTASCFATQGAFQLCAQQSECLKGTCQAYAGDPGWVKACQ